MTMIKLIPFALFGMVCAAVGCGRTTNSGAQTSPTVATGQPTVPAPKPTTPTKKPKPAPGTIVFPQAESSGGRVQTSPKVLPIVFQGDPLQSSIADFHKKLAGSQYWKDAATEYGISDIQARDLVVVNETAPASTTDAEIQTWLQTKIQSGAFGAADSNTMYAIYYPTGTTISLDGEQSCQSFGGYHNETNVGATKVGYGIMPRCGALGRGTDLDSLTITASHEVFEWATDPFPFSEPAWQGMQSNHLAWQLAFLGELSDLCTGIDYEYVRPVGLEPFTVQRHWSNKLAAEGHFPCAPARTSSSYYVGVPMVSDTIDLGRGFKTKGVSVPAGGSKTIPVQFNSDNPNDEEWQIQAVDAEAFGRGGRNGGNSSAFTFDLDGDTGKHGDTVNLTVTAAKGADYSLFYIVASRGRRFHVWPALAVVE